MARLKGILLTALLLGSTAPLVAQSLERDVFYHVFVRSFRDSNGDRQGDLRGIEQSLDYLQRLGVTALLLTPINPSPFYHNYFGTSFEGVDTAFGGTAAYTSLVRAVHRRRMKIFLDQEIQYAAKDHPWWKESAGNPASPYSKFLIYHGPGNTDPESGPFGITTGPMWNGETFHLTTLNLREPAVVEYFAKLFSDLVDPNHDGKFEDGVDGFRIDHMMDTLDSKKDLPGLFATLWAPVFAKARATNPRIRIIAEQWDWGYGDDFLTRGGTDAVFAFPIRFGIVELNRATTAEAIAETARRTGAGKDQLVFIENHDTDRFASTVESDPRKLRLGAALMLLLKGTPSIYYGQEIGMRGKQFKEYKTDANDIPVREAMEWKAKNGGAGDADWYRDSGPWWTNRHARDNDGVSVEEEERDPASLLNWYRTLTRIRRDRTEVQAGSQQVLDVGAPGVLAVLRGNRKQTLFLANFDSSAVSVTMPAFINGPLRDLTATGSTAPVRPSTISLPPYGVAILGN